MENGRACLPKKSLGKRISINLLRDWRLYVMLLLPLAFYAIFCYKPMYGVIIAFKKYNIAKGINGSKWILIVLVFQYTIENTISFSFSCEYFKVLIRD